MSRCGSLVLRAAGDGVRSTMIDASPGADCGAAHRCFLSLDITLHSKQRARALPKVQVRNGAELMNALAV